MPDSQTDESVRVGASPVPSHHAFEAARDIVLIVGTDGAILDVNHAAVRAYGHDRTKLTSMSIFELRAPGATPVVMQQLQEAAHSGVLFETTHVRADGSNFPVEVSSSAIELGGKTALVSIVRDISERENRERTLQSLLDSSREANRRLDGMLRLLSGAVSADGLDSILDATVSIVSEIMATDVALFLVAENGSMRVRANVGGDPWIAAGRTLGPGEGFAGRVGRSTHAMYVADIAETDMLIDAHTCLGIRSMLGVPVFVDNELFGVLECAWFACREVDDAERMTLQLAAERIATAIARARLLEHSRRAERLTRAVNDISGQLNASLGVKASIEPALRVAAEALGCDVALYSTSRDGAWRVEYSHGLEGVLCTLAVDHVAFSDTSTSRPVVVTPAHPAFSVLAEELGIRSSIAIPFHGRRDHDGTIVLGSRDDDLVFDDAALSFAARVSETVSVALSNAMHFETEHRIAEALQEALLTVPDRVPGIEFSHLYRSATLATRVGGDFFDVFEMTDGRVGITIGDVSGKGLEAAVLTSIIKDTIRAYAQEAISPARVIAKANVVLERAATLPDFASVFFGVLDGSTGDLCYCCAGHPPGAVLGRGGDVRLLECGSPVIGAFADLEYVDHLARLAPDETVFLYTDGITEARRADREFFGDVRLISVLAGATQRAVAEIPGIAFDAVMAFSDGRLSDDIAVLAFRRP